MAKQGQRLNDELKERIRAELVLSENKNEIAKKLGVSWATVDKVEKETRAAEGDDKFETLRDNKKQEMIELVWNSMMKAATLGDRLVQEALNGQKDIPLNHVSTFYGTMYDKHALMTGGKTAEVGLTYEEQLKQLLGGAS